MGSTSDKVAGYANQAIGTIKQSVGKAVGSEKLQAKGAVQELKGKGQVAVGDVKATIKDGADAADDAFNKNL